MVGVMTTGGAVCLSGLSCAAGPLRSAAALLRWMSCISLCSSDGGRGGMSGNSVASF